MGVLLACLGIKYESADEALERLNDYGCLHFKTPILLGISEPATPIKCECGKLIAIVRNGKVYIKCKGCKHEVEIPTIQK